MNTELTLASALLIEKAAKVGIDVSESERKQIENFISRLAAYNEHTNLVSKAEPRIIAVDHVLDSLSLITVVRESLTNGKKVPAKFIDIGTGAGFPGLILSIFLKELQFTLVDSVEKKTRFLSETVTALNLKNVQVVTDRVEELAHIPSFREKFGFASARAVGAAGTTMELACPFLSVDGILILQKSLSQLPVELTTVKDNAREFGCAFVNSTELDIDVYEKERVLITVSKVRSTDKMYPRQWRKIKNSPFV